MSSLRPQSQGLYDPSFEHDACGVGFLVDLKGRKSHKLVRDAIRALINLDHRGAVGSDATGDGAGILIQIPHGFMRTRCEAQGIELPGPGHYGVGAFFCSPDEDNCMSGQSMFEKIVRQEGLQFLGWRKLKTDSSKIGDTARAVEPAVYHAYIASPYGDDTDRFERKLFVLRKVFEKAMRESGRDDGHYFYFPSLSCRTLVYKGMLTPEQVGSYYADDLEDPLMESAFAIYHSRFSTNTFPSWELAHPYRMIAHNGEINTLRGNINWMRARESLFASNLYEPGDVEKLLPIITEGLSDTACLDNAVELLIKSGYSPAHAMMMLVPEAWEHHESMSQSKKDFYHYHGCLIEPWDGPASVVFTDGRNIGAVLDRNGLRPSRYYVTKDDMVVMASEVGVLPEIAPEDIVLKGRLEPGKMFLIDMVQGRIVGDDELKSSIASAKPYGEWLNNNLVKLEKLPPAAKVPEPDHDTLLHRQLAFGYTLEDLKYILAPMGNDGAEAIGSMGTDTPLAVLSDRPQPIFNYFKQLFAQVTNPPLDAIREECVTSVLTNIGPEENLLEPSPRACHVIELKSPILDNDETARFKALNGWEGFKSTVLDMTFPASKGAAGLEAALEEIFDKAVRAIATGTTMLILSDRAVGPDRAPIPSLLACSGLHHHLVRQGLRTRVGLVVECGDAREVHHFALLLGYGAGAINPYVAFETLDDMIKQGFLKAEIDHEEAVEHYRKAIKKGVIKVMSKMGISTIQSYRGAQIFEAVGLNENFISKYFEKTASRISGAGLPEITQEVLASHSRAYNPREAGTPLLDWGGQYQWRREGEFHLFNPETVFRLQHATKTQRYDIFKQYTRMVDDQNERLCTLRGLFDFRFDQASPVPIDEVESVESIVRRFATGAMSLGSISEEAHETLAIAMNRLGGRSNTGEGGEDPRRFKPDANGDNRRSSIKQVASGRFGVTSEYLVNSDELQIKMAQGAKPGEGGQLPGSKVSPYIAKVRHTTPGVGLISPPPHHDIYSIEDLKQLIHDLKNSNPRARISVKLVAEVGVGTVAAGVAKAHSDVVLISGFDGGTGASPLTSLKHAGIPWELGLAETQQTLVLNGLRDRIVVQADGQMKTGRDVVVASLLGAEEFGFATAPLVVMGCIMMRVCHLGTCPVGIATQNEKLREKFAGRAEHVVNFFKFIAEEVRELMAKLGFRSMDEMIGRSDLLNMKSAIEHYKAKGLDFSKIFFRPEVGPDVALRRVREQDHGLDKALDQKLVAEAAPALERGEAVVIDTPIINVNRTVGTILGSEVTRKYGGGGLPEDTIRVNFTGSAGQSFGAFVPKGITLSLTGDANDYVGKGLSGGKIVVTPPKNVSFDPAKNVIIGNVALYGATGGRAFFRGMAGERFCVRNSGALAVVEGVGDHGCEYMTGGVAVVIGPTGRNFAAGMSGGMAFIYDPKGDFPVKCNMEMVELEKFADKDDIDLVRDLLIQHAGYTGSTVAAELLGNWEAVRSKFVKVMPVDYRRVLLERKRAAETTKLATAKA
ncbi:glutamate synthase large subunit [bacterium]|nr:glutamate synthase large subunit [bacterium]